MLTTQINENIILTLNVSKSLGYHLKEGGGEKNLD